MSKRQMPRPENKAAALILALIGAVFLTGIYWGIYTVADWLFSDYPHTDTGLVVALFLSLCWALEYLSSEPNIP